MAMKTLTAGVLAATLSFTSMAPTTAAAEFSRDDALVGITALLLLGAAIHHNRDDNSNSTPARSTPRATPRTQPRNDAWRVLPAQCLTQATRRNGDRVRFFGQRCMSNNYRAVNRLPQACRVEFRTRDGGVRRGYRASCLRDQGFRTTRQ